MQITFVLGIHRSGTSLLAAGLEALGADLGRFNNKRNVDNPKGEFEHGDIVAFNDRLLAHLGASWDNWGLHLPSQADRLPDLTGWRDDAAALLAGMFDATSTSAVVKDPRITTLLPFWSDVVRHMGWTPRHVLVLRPPAEVAASQCRRAARQPDAFPLIADPAPMSALWAVHSHAMLTALPETDTLLVRHDALYTKTGQVLDQIAGHLGLMPDPERLRAYLGAHLDLSLRHGIAPGVPPSSGLWQTLADTLYRDLVPPGPTGALDGARARALAARQSGLVQQLPGLDAVRASLGSATTNLAPGGSSATPLTKARNLALWGLSQSLVSSDARVLDTLRAALGAPDIAALSDLAVLVVRARLAIAAGDIAAAAAIHDTMERSHPDNDTARQIVQGFRAAHTAAAPAPTAPSPDA